MAKAENHDPAAIVIGQQRDESDAQSVFGACRTHAVALINDSTGWHFCVAQMRGAEKSPQNSRNSPTHKISGRAGWFVRD